MIIDKVQPYWTPEDTERLEEIRKQQKDILSRKEETPAEHSKSLKQWGDLEDESDCLLDDIENRYVKAASKRQIMADISEILEAVEKDDFLRFVQKAKEQLPYFSDNSEGSPIAKDLAKETPENCYRFLMLHVIRVQMNAIEDDEERSKKADHSAKKKIAEWYQLPDGFLKFEIVPFTPKNHIMQNDSIINRLQRENAIELDDDPVGHDVTVLKRKRGLEITTYLMATFHEDNSITFLGSDHLTEYERQVSDSIVTLLEAAREKKEQPVFTINQIFKEMPGGSDKPSDQQRESIKKTLEKLSNLTVKVDATDEFRQRGLISEGETYTFKEKYLTWREHNLTTRNGKNVLAYEITVQPPVLTYAKMTNQLLTVPVRNIAIEKVKDGKATGQLIAMTTDRQAMTGNIVRKIEIMRRDTAKAIENKRKYDSRRKKDPSLEEKPLSSFKRYSNTILFQTLFQDVGIYIDSRDKAKEARNFCFSVLDYQKAIGKIKGYSKKINGRTIIGVDIVF